MASNPDVAQQRWFGGLRYSAERGCVIRRDGAEVVLRAQSLAVFRYLSERPDSVVTKEALRAVIWPNVVVTDDSLVQCMADIRRVLGNEHRHVLRTIPRQGYLMSPDAESAPAPSDSAIPTEMLAPTTGEGMIVSPGVMPPSARDSGTAQASRGRGPRKVWLVSSAVLILAVVVGVALLRT